MARPGAGARATVHPAHDRGGRLANDARVMTDPVTVTVAAGRVRRSDLDALFQRGVAVPISGLRSVGDFLTVDLAIDAGYIRDKIATVFVDSMVVDDLDRATLRPGSTLTLSAAMPGLVGATLRRSSYYAAMRAEVSWHEPARARLDGEPASTVKVKLFNLIIPGLGPSILRRGIVLDHEEAVRLLGPDLEPERLTADRAILLRVVT